MHLSPEQHDILMRPLNTARIAKRSQGGKQLSYLEAWDVKAHLIRVFGFGNWDSEVIREQFMGAFPYKDGEMIEVVWQATVRLTIRTEAPDAKWSDDTIYQEGAVGSATGKAGTSGIGDLHDNALKQAASDALKRCAINLGTQFGLSLYDDGNTNDIVKRVLVGAPPPAPKSQEQLEREQSLAKTVGATSEPGTSGPAEHDVQGTDDQRHDPHPA